MRQIHATEVAPRLVRTRSTVVEIPWPLALMGWFIRRIFRLVVWFLRHRIVTGTLLAVWAVAQLVQAVGSWVIPTTVFSLLAVLAIWRHASAESFSKVVGWRFRGAFRRLLLYRFKWEAAMITTDLSERLPEAHYVPKLIKVRATGSVDWVTVRMLPGQTVEDWSKNADRLAATFGVVDCRVRSIADRPDRVMLWFLVDDTLRNLIPPIDPAPVPALDALPVAVREDRLVYKLRLLGTHVLVAGATGAGKGSVVWSILDALAPAIRSGHAQVWALDPKGGIELAAGRKLFARFCYGDPESPSYETGFADVLEEAVAVMRDRQSRLRGLTRLHTPSPAEPLIVLMIDEMASLTSAAYMTDNQARKRIAAALSLLLSQGRAMGVTVVGALQDARKENLAFRDLFPTRIGLRMTEPDQVRLVLGDGARDRGARCDHIPESLPGVAYAAVDGEAEPVRLRFPFITDDRIAQLVEAYAPGPRLVTPTDEQIDRGEAA